jgi:hypothetical protein
MEVGKNVTVRGLERARVFGIAAVAGFIATLAIVGLIMISETVLGFPRGLFYAVIGNVLGSGGTEAMNLGLYLHLLAGTFIGVICATPVAAIKRVYISMYHVEKRLLYGVIVGFVVWILFFVPVSYSMVAPTIEHLKDGFLDVTGKLIRGEEITGKFSTIIFGALGFHIQYGLIYAIITGSYAGRHVKVLSK